MRPITRRTLMLSAIGLGGLATLTSDDLTGLFLSPVGSPRATQLAADSESMRYRQGQIVAWDPTTLANKIRVGGTVLENLPVLGVSEAASYETGTVVGLIVVGNTWAIVGRFVIPGTDGATDALNLIANRTKSASIAGTVNTSSGSFVDLGPGPIVSDVQVGPAGKAIVTVSCTFNYGTSAVIVSAGGTMSYAVSGATTQAADSARGPTSFLNLAATTTVIDRKSLTYLVEGLNPGLHTFTAKYRSEVGGVVCNFSDRNLTAQGL